MADVAYCTKADAERILSAAGVAARTDDDPDDDLDIDAELINEASAELDGYLLRGYAPEQLVTSRWVKYTAALYAAILYCGRRGNPVPAALQDRWDRRLKILERVATAGIDVPGLARRRNAFPTVSQPRVILGPLTPATVIERRRGPQRNFPQDYPQRTDRTEPPPYR